MTDLLSPAKIEALNTASYIANSPRVIATALAAYAPSGKLWSEVAEWWKNECLARVVELKAAQARIAEVCETAQTTPALLIDEIKALQEFCAQYEARIVELETKNEVGNDTGR